MQRIRIIPSLLMHKGGLVKSVKFKNYKYVGDPINAVKLFNDKEVDEIALIDIDATRNKKAPDIKKIREIASEAFMPMAYGGGITNINQIKEIFYNGIEKVILNKSAFSNGKLITEAANQFGSQSVVASIDVKRQLFKGYKVYVENGNVNTGINPVEYAKRMMNLGAGEILLNNIDRDGTYKGYDLDLIHEISSSVSIPIIALGGAGSLSDFLQAINNGAAAVSAGSLFVFQRPHNAVLVSYPSQQRLKEEVYKQINRRIK